jgi:trehalose-6-phosphate hydrolase
VTLDEGSCSTTGGKWWQNTVFYEIVVASFQDSNGDGIGDFGGLTSRLDYLQDLGVTGLWITPYYPSPGVDNGYDVSDHIDVDPDFGNLADFDRFIEQAHSRSIKVIIDVVLNHVSTEHRWFQQAVSDPESEYRDYFFFQNLPNGWESFFGGSAWALEPNGDQYYYHKFAPQQADLNWQNKSVMDDMTGVLKFWLDRGVDGFRFDVINFLSCDGIGDENPVGSDGKQIHSNDIDQHGIYSCVSDICDFARRYSTLLGSECFLVGEVGHEELAKLAPFQSRDLLDVVFNFNLGSIAHFDIVNIHNQLVAMEDRLSGFPTLFFNSHDMPRSISRLCHDDVAQAAALAALMLTARGVCFLYYGEEIGMPDFLPGSIDDMRDAKAANHFRLALAAGKSVHHAYEIAIAESRDKSRLYMQWNDDEYSGFSTAPPWIGRTAPGDQPKVADQINSPDSLWHWYRKLIALRQGDQALSLGDYGKLLIDDKLLSISRLWRTHIVHILINFNTAKRRIHRSNSHDVLADRGLVSGESEWLAPFGVLITRQTLDVS